MSKRRSFVLGDLTMGPDTCHHAATRIVAKAVDAQTASFRHEALGFEHMAHNATTEHEALSSALFRTIVETFDRDNTLRHTYLRRRWQGLVN